MSVHLSREIEKLKKKVLFLSAIVERAIAQSIAALLERNSDLAEEVMNSDDEVDRMEVEVEEDCLKLLALHQPVAADLRFVVTVLKMNNDLERMGDIAANIAKRARFLSNHPEVRAPEDIPLMAAKARSMVQQSLDALVNSDPALARQVCSSDESLDRLRADVESQILDLIRADPDHAAAWMEIRSVTRHLERLGDMATNVAEDVIYMIEGDIIRHGQGNP